MNLHTLKVGILTNVDRANCVNMWSLANSLSSHKDREVVELAFFSIEMMKELFPEEILNLVNRK